LAHHDSKILQHDQDTVIINLKNKPCKFIYLEQKFHMACGYPPQTGYQAGAVNVWFGLVTVLGCGISVHAGTI
jgi:hypothetical protein